VSYVSLWGFVMLLQRAAYLGVIVFFLSFIISSFFFSCTQVAKIDNFKINKFDMNSYGDESPFPNKNFIFLEKYLTLDDNNETCYKKPSECTGLGPMIASASGAVVKKFGDTAYILTAGHFCSDEGEGVDKVDDKHAVRAYAAYVQNFHLPIRILKVDLENDLCLMSAKDPDIRRMNFDRLKVRKSEPKIGEKVYTVSAPLGIYSPFSRHHFSGNYSGCSDYFKTNQNFCFYTIAAAEGSSGSLVLDKQGKIVGMIQLALIGFDNISMGIHQEQIRLFLNDAAEELNIIF
jgi:S1-C subfamily serine protease